MTLSLILTTIGRPSLADALDSLVHQEWRAGDEILVVSDDLHDHVACMLRGLPPLVRHIALEAGPHGDWGHTPRNLVMPQCRGDHILHFDDDDLMLPGAVTQIRLDLVIDPVSVHLYRFLKFVDRQRVWTDPPRLAVNHVGTPNIVHPNRPETFGTWRPKHGGDGDFIIETCTRVGGHVWHPTVTCVVAPPTGWGVKRVCDWVRSRPLPRRCGDTRLGRLIDASFNRKPWSAPSGCGVLTATDDRFFPAVQLLYHSLAGYCPLAVVDLGTSHKNADWLAGRVDVLLPAGPAHCGRGAWQTWNKPWYVERGPFARTLWLDADCMVVGDLTPLFERLSSNPLLTRHWDGDKYQGDLGPAVPEPAYPFRPGTSVNAGVLGLCPGRDTDLLTEWKRACVLAASSAAAAESFRWYDESALHWAVRQTGRFDAVVDRPGWNRLAYVRPVRGKPPPLSPQEFVTALPRHQGDVVLHFAVKDKPWRFWANRTHLWE